MNQIIKILKKSKRVAVFGHQSPDGDCLGSISAIHFLLQNLGKRVDAFIDDNIPKMYNFLQFDYINAIEFEKNKYDLLISVDVASKRMLGKYSEIFDNFEKTVVIDHHKNRDLNGKYTFVDKNKSSCSEIIFDMVIMAKQKPTKDIATKLYMGVVDDTGCFLHSNTTSSTHITASKLIEYGANVDLVNYNIIKLITKKNFLATKVLNNEVVFSSGLTYVIINEKLMSENGFTKQDISGYVNMLCNIEDTKIAFVMTEKQNGVFSVSLRSNVGYDVSNIATTFGGGGHTQASGCEISQDVEENTKRLINLCKKEIKGKNNV